MNSLALHAWAQTLTQLVVQVALWLVVGTLLVAWARRRSAHAAVETTTWILGGVLLLTVLAVSPWPAWYALPALIEEPEPAPPLRTAGAPQAAPALPAPLSWEMGRIDLPAPPIHASPGLTSGPLTGTADRRELPTARSTCWWARMGAVLVTMLAGGCLLRFGVALWAIRECRRRSRRILDADVQQLCEQLRRAMGVHRPVELRELFSLNTPATLGWLRPVILLPADWPSWDIVEKTSVLAHELAHIRRGDYAGWLLAQLSLALHGYQPLLLSQIGRLRRDQELAADALAASFAGGPARYTQALCRLALRRDDGTKPGLARAFLPAHLSLTLRVQMLLSRNRRSETMIELKWRVGLALALVATCLTVAGLRSPALAEQPANPAVETAPDTKSAEVTPTAGRAAREREIERMLNVPITLDYKDTPLSQVIDDLRRDTGINIILDMPALDEEGIGLDQPVTMNLEDVKMRSALSTLLHSIHLTYIIKDEAMQVTTPKRSRGKLVQKTYPVADLVIPIKNYDAASPKDGAPAAPAAPQAGSRFVLDPLAATDGTPGAPGASIRQEKTQTDEERLIRLIVSTIEPSTWSEVGGPGTINYFPLGMALVISQTPDVHEQIAELLDALRRLQDMEVSTEIRLVTVSGMMARRLKREFGVDCTPRGQHPGQAVTRASFLKQGQLEKLLEALQGDRRTNILQAPRLTLFNGQNATIQSEEIKLFTTGMETKWDGEQLRTTPKAEVYPVGFRIGVQAVVSADQRFVRLQLQSRLSELAPSVPKTSVTATQTAPKGDRVKAAPVTQEVEQPTLNVLQLDTTVSVPDGGTAVLSGWKRSGPRAGQNGSGAEPQYLLMMVTPRILINSEEEAVNQTGTVSAVAVDEGRSKQAKVSELLAKYQEACRERRFAEAKKLAAAALMLAPGCFSQGR